MIKDNFLTPSSKGLSEYLSSINKNSDLKFFPFSGTKAFSQYLSVIPNQTFALVVVYFYSSTSS